MSRSAASNRRDAIFARDGWRCVYCGQVFDPDQLSIDHVEPRVKQGDHSAGNLVTACATCNRQKGGRAAWQYLADQPEARSNFLRYARHVWPRLRRAVQEAAVTRPPDSP